MTQIHCYMADCSFCKNELSDKENIGYLYTCKLQNIVIINRKCINYLSSKNKHKEHKNLANKYK